MKNPKLLLNNGNPTPINSSLANKVHDADIHQETFETYLILLATFYCSHDLNNLVTESPVSKNSLTPNLGNSTNDLISKSLNHWFTIPHVTL